MALYASTAQIKAAMRITDSVDDSLISMAGSAASELIDGYCGRTFGTVTETRYFAPSDSHVLQIDDLAGTAGLTIQSSTLGDGDYDVTWTATDYQLEPLNGVADGLYWPYTRVRAVGDYLWPALYSGVATYGELTGYGEVSVKIAGTWGWPSVPVTITQAAVIQASRIYKRLDSPLGVAGFGEMGAMRVSRHLDPDVAQLVAPYVRHFGVA
jgi:hypothetical protein